MTGAWRCRDHEIELGRRTLVMGIVNVTPDSFSDGGKYLETDDAVKHGLRLVAEGADLLDVGGESTRPGADPVDPAEESARVLPVIERLHAELAHVPISVDTRRSEVATRAIAAGASIVNDVTSGSDPETFEVAASSGAGLILMHMRGEPRTMQDDPRYDDVVREVRDALADRVGAAVAVGVRRAQLCVDPGIGFGKKLEHNLELLRAIGSFRDLRAAVMVGVSRKRFVGALTDVEDAEDRLEGSLAAGVWCASQGVDVVRVHDVRETVRALAIVDAIARPRREA